MTQWFLNILKLWTGTIFIFLFEDRHQLKNLLWTAKHRIETWGSIHKLWEFMGFAATFLNQTKSLLQFTLAWGDSQFHINSEVHTCMSMKHLIPLTLFSFWLWLEGTPVAAECQYYWTIMSRDCGKFEVLGVIRRWNLCLMTTLNLILTLNDSHHDTYPDPNRTSRRVWNILLRGYCDFYTELLRWPPVFPSHFVSFLFMHGSSSG